MHNVFYDISHNYQQTCPLSITDHGGIFWVRYLYLSHLSWKLIGQQIFPRHASLWVLTVKLLANTHNRCRFSSCAAFLRPLEVGKGLSIALGGHVYIRFTVSLRKNGDIVLYGFLIFDIFDRWFDV